MAQPLSLQDALAVLDTYNRQIEALTRQLNFLQAVLDETGRARDSLEGLRKEAHDDVLIPLGANTFVRGKATDKKVAIAGIGAGYAVEKTWDEAEARLAEREAEIRKEMDRVTQATVQLQREAARLQEELEAAVDESPSGRRP